MQYSPAGEQLATSGEDHRIQLWDASTGRNTATLRGHANYVLGLAYAPSGARLASADLDGSVRVWALDTFTEIAERGDETMPIYTLVFSPDGGRLASASVSGRVRVLDSESLEPVCEATGQANVFNDMVFSPDGQQIMLTSPAGRVELRSVSDCAQLASFPTGQGTIWALAYDGTHLVVASDQLRVWDVASATQLHALDASSQVVTDIVLLPEAKLATASIDHSVELWDLESGELLVSLEGDGSFVEDLALSPDGPWLALARSDGRATVRDASKGELRTTFADRVAARDAEGNLRWPIPASELLTHGCERLAAFDEFLQASDICDADGLAAAMRQR